MVLTFTCNNCNALLKKCKIMRHYCLNPDNKTSSEINHVIDNQNNNNNESVVVSKKKFPSIALTFSNQEWNNFVATSLIKHETNDENLRLVLSGLRFRKNFPRKENKFHNYINAFLPSKNVPGCSKIIWDIVIDKLKEYSANTSCLETKSETSIEKESISLNKRKLDTDNLTMELNSDMPEEKKTKLSDDIIILSDTVPIESEHKVPNDTIGVLEENTKDLSENISLPNMNANAPEIDKLTQEINENLMLDQNIPEKVIQSDGLVASIKKVVPNKDKPLNRNLLWKEKAIERLSRYETEDENMKIVINSLKYKRFLPQREDKFIKLLSTIPKSRKIKDCCKIIWGVINGEEYERLDQNIPQQSEIEILNPELDNEFLDLLKINGSLETLNSQNVNVKIISENKEETKSVTVESLSQNHNLSKPMTVNPVVKISQPSKLIDSNEIHEKKPLKPRHILTTEEWHMNVMMALNKHQTTDTDLLILIARLKNRNNIPQKFFKFKNFIHNIPLSHKIANCADLLWDIILPGNPDTSKNKLDALSSGMPILKSVDGIDNIQLISDKS